MSIKNVTHELRSFDAFHHIDMGFLNHRLCLTALFPEVRERFMMEMKSGTDHFTQWNNDHLLVTHLLDCCETAKVPTLLSALAENKPRIMFKSTEAILGNKVVYNQNARVELDVDIPVDYDKPVILSFGTEHLVSDTGTMTLSEGSQKGYRHSIVGLLHNDEDRFRIEPLVIGAPWFDHPRNGDACGDLMWLGYDFGEILPEDVEQFSKMRDVAVADADEWMSVMKRVPEEKVKRAFCKLLSEPAKKDWGGESNDHFSANLMVGGERKTGAFLLKGPSKFREMTLDMCGARADQIYRLTQVDCDVYFVQHSHLIGEAVRATLRSLVVFPGRPRKYCVIDGHATYRILKAYGLIEE